MMSFHLKGLVEKYIMLIIQVIMKFGVSAFWKGLLLKRRKGLEFLQEMIVEQFRARKSCCLRFTEALAKTVINLKISSIDFIRV